MKMNKDSVLKMGDYTFKFEDIETIEMAGGWLSIKAMGKYGMRIQAEIQLKDVEFLNSAPPKGSRADEYEVVSPLGTMKKAVDEVVNQTAPKVQWKMNPYSQRFFDSIAKSIDKDNEVEKVIEEMLNEAAMEAKAADRRRLVKIIKGIMRSGG